MMKYLSLILISFLGFGLSQAQILDRLADKAINAAERTVENKVEEKTKETTGKILDNVLDGKKKKSKSTNEESQTEADASGFEGIVKGAMESGSLLGDAGSDLPCPVMGIDAIYVGAATATTQRLVRPQENNDCGCEIELSGKIIPLTITAHKTSEDEIKKEISAYKGESGGMLSAQNSATGNAVFGIHKPNKFLVILDPNSDYVYKFNFSTTQYSAVNPEKTMVEYEKAKQIVINIANHFLKIKK